MSFVGSTSVLNSYDVGPAEDVASVLEEAQIPMIDIVFPFGFGNLEDLKDIVVEPGMAIRVTPRRRVHQLRWLWRVCPCSDCRERRAQ